MRIACLSTDPGIPFGATKGAAVHLASIVTALAAEGMEVLLLVPETAPQAQPPPGVVLETLPGPGRTASAAARVRFDPALAEWLAGRLRAFGADALYERLALHSAAGSDACGRVGITHLVELNAPLLEEASRYRTLFEPGEADRLERATLAAADTVLVVSPPLARYAAARGARRVEVLPNAADVDRYPLRRWTDIATVATPTAVFAGSLRPWHGIETIARAWQILGEEAPPLLVVGDGPERAVLEGPGVRFAGAVPPSHVPELLVEAQIGLAPYGADGPRYFSPLKLFEYLAAGLATVVGDLPAVLDVVDDETAIVIRCGDAGALADAVHRLAADPLRCRSLGDRGRALIEAKHTWRHRARRIVELVSMPTPAGPAA